MESYYSTALAYIIKRLVQWYPPRIGWPNLYGYFCIACLHENIREGRKNIDGIVLGLFFYVIVWHVTTRVACEL